MNLSDKDLDRLFREASDRFEPDGSMLSWNRLEKNLAGQLPERPPGPRGRFGFRPIVWVPAAVLVAGISLFLIINHQPYRSLSTLPSSVTAPAPPAPGAGQPHAISPVTAADSTGAITAGSARDSASGGTSVYGAAASASPTAEVEDDLGGGTSGTAHPTDSSSMAADRKPANATETAVSPEAAGTIRDSAGEPDNSTAAPAGTRGRGNAFKTGGVTAEPGPASLTEMGSRKSSNQTETAVSKKIRRSRHAQGAGRYDAGNAALQKQNDHVENKVAANDPGADAITTKEEANATTNKPSTDNSKTNHNTGTAGAGNTRFRKAHGSLKKSANTDDGVNSSAAARLNAATSASGTGIGTDGNALLPETAPESAAAINGAGTGQKTAGHRSARPEYARATLPLLSEHAPPSIVTSDAALRVAAGQQKNLPLPSRSMELSHPLTLGIVMGPDYTDGGVTNGQLGNSIGLSISYYLSNRLSVNTGILYGVKSYSAKGQDFQPPRNPLRAPGSFPHLESANGSVTLFEIPLSLRYDFPLDDKTRLFASAGLSSYLPVKETFTTYFHDQGRIYAWRHINNDPQSHWFAVGHFSGGMERDLGKGLSFQAEPFLNLPFTSVGAGKVRLNTYGLLFSIRYTPVLGRKKR